MKKMTLAQKQRRLKEIKADLDKVLKRNNKPKQESFSEPLVYPEKLIEKLRQHHERVALFGEADHLPGEWVKLPPMKWPATLPVEVPIEPDKWCGLNLPGHDCGTAHSIIRAMYHWIAGDFDDNAPSSWSVDRVQQSAWSETLVRLGYTEDA